MDHKNTENRLKQGESLYRFAKDIVDPKELYNYLIQIIPSLKLSCRKTMLFIFKRFLQYNYNVLVGIGGPDHKIPMDIINIINDLAEFDIERFVIGTPDEREPELQKLKKEFPQLPDEMLTIIGKNYILFKDFYIKKYWDMDRYEKAIYPPDNILELLRPYQLTIYASLGKLFRLYHDLKSEYISNYKKLRMLIKEVDPILTYSRKKPTPIDLLVYKSKENICNARKIGEGDLPLFFTYFHQLDKVLIIPLLKQMNRAQRDIMIYFKIHHHGMINTMIQICLYLINTDKEKVYSFIKEYRGVRFRSSTKRPYWETRNPFMPVYL